MTSCKQLAFGALMAGLVGSAQALPVDGGFESLVLTGGNYLNLLENYGPGGAVGASWTNASNFVLGIDTTYTEGGGLRFVAQEGTKSLDLTGAGYQGEVALSQTLALSAGQYVLSFFLGDIRGQSSYVLASSVEVLFGGNSLGIFTNAAGTTTTNWMEVVVPFTSNGVNNTLTFSTRGLTLDSYTGLDNVTVTAAIPEPGSLALVLASLGAAGFAARRRAAVGTRA